jgi:hypothetical protein
MSFLERTLRTVRVPLTALAIMAVPGCGGGKGGGDCHTTNSCPPPTKSVAVDASSATPSTINAGQTTTLYVHGKGTNTTIDSVAFTIDGTRFPAIAGTEGSKSYTPATAGSPSITATVYGNGNSGVINASQAIALTVNAAPTPVLTPVSVSFNEAGSQNATLSATNCTSPVYSLGTPSSANFAPTLAGNVLTLKGVNDDVNGAYAVPINVACAEGNASATATAAIAAKPDLTFTPRDALDGGALGAFDIRVQGQTIHVNGATKVQLNEGTALIELVAGQASVHDFQRYKLNTGVPNVVVSQANASYNTTLPLTDVAVEVTGLAKDRHAEFQGNSYASFRRIWGVGINAPIGINRIVAYTAGSNGGGVLGCDQVDMTAAQIAAFNTGADSLMKYVHPNFPNVTVTQTTTKPVPHADGGVATGDNLFCPGNIGNAGYIRNGIVEAEISRYRGNIGGVIFQELMPTWWGNPTDREDSNNTGYSMFDQDGGPTGYPQLLDRSVMALMPIAIESKTQNKTNLQF